MDEEKRVVKTEWYSQLPGRPLVGIISVWDGYAVKQYIGTTGHENMACGIKEIMDFGAKYREYSPDGWTSLFGPLPQLKRKA